MKNEIPINFIREDGKILKVKVLNKDLKKRVKEFGWNENDLVLIEIITKITRIEGSPTEFLQKKYGIID